jgi:hypothetical protein
MTSDEILQILIKAPTLHKNQLKLIKNSLLNMAKIYDDMEYLDKRFFNETLNGAIRLIITRLVGHLDINPCKDLWKLLLVLDNSYRDELSEWIATNILTEYFTSNKFSDEVKRELVVFSLIAIRLNKA